MKFITLILPVLLAMTDVVTAQGRTPYTPSAMEWFHISALTKCGTRYGPIIMGYKVTGPDEMTVNFAYYSKEEEQKCNEAMKSIMACLHEIQIEHAWSWLNIIPKKHFAGISDENRVK